MSETPWTTRERGVVLLTDHTRTTPAGDFDFHQWIVLPGWRDSPITVRRDRLGRQAPDRIIAEDWLVLICNNTDCAARAAFRVRLIEDAVESLMPALESQGSGS